MVIISYYLSNIVGSIVISPFVIRNICYLHFLFYFPLSILMQVSITFVSLSQTQLLVALILVCFPFQWFLLFLYYLFSPIFEGFFFQFTVILLSMTSHHRNWTCFSLSFSLYCIHSIFFLSFFFFFFFWRVLICCFFPTLWNGIVGYWSFHVFCFIHLRL